MTVEEQPFTLGEVQVVEVGPGLFVANVLAQEGYRSRARPVPLRYDALQQGLGTIAQWCAARDMPAHMPRIGCGERMSSDARGFIVGADSPLYRWLRVRRSKRRAIVPS